MTVHMTVHNKTAPAGLSAFSACAKAGPIRLAYFVHDLGDPAVARRLAMLRPYLASAIIIGFHRAATPPALVEGWPVLALGRTKDGKLRQRAVAVVQNLFLLPQLRRHLAGTDVIMARQLEMLTLATAARRIHAKSAALVYECLDIHRMMLGTGAASAALRFAEGRLLHAAELLVVSSPAFVEEYFTPRHNFLPPVCLIENKVLQEEIIHGTSAPLPPGPPWRIGWYGVLRCRRSLKLLIALSNALPGQIIVELRGRPARAAIPDFDTLVAAAPHVIFHGAYDRQRDLADMYRSIHFTWAIDFYEAGQNSAWLLPNRLYEGGAYGAVPLAMAGVETGRWLARENAGILFGDSLAEELLAFFSNLSPRAYAATRENLQSIPATHWIDDGTDTQRLLAALTMPQT